MANFPTESAWKAVAQKHKLKDNGLQRALATYEKLGEDKHGERIQALDAAKRLASSLGKSKEVAANAEAKRFLAGLESAAESTKKLVASAATKAGAQAAAGKRPDFSKVKTVNSEIRKLATLSKAETRAVAAAKGGGGAGEVPCLDEAGDAAVAAAELAAATIAVDAAAAATGLSAGLATVALIATLVLAAKALTDYIEAMKKLVACLKRHNNPAQRANAARIEQAIALRALLLREKERLGK